MAVVVDPAEPDPVDALTADYLIAAAGDRDKALQLAVAELLQIHAQAAQALTALDQWTSRGYVRGRASDRLASASPAFSTEVITRAE